MSTYPELPQLLKRRLFYQGRKFSFEVNRLRLPNKAEGEMECIRHPGGAVAVPLTEDGKLILVRQYRFATGRRLLEFPAGTLETGEDALETARREIQEETGYKAHRWDRLGQFYVAPGYSDEIIYSYLARGLELLENPPSQDEDEDLEIVFMGVSELEEAILNGEAVDAKSIASLVLLKPFLDKEE
ncbi:MULTISPECIES: NUDIX hydrolase [unclassified Leptolyngbya]|uniref:NUDIX hydrolase n=1 Tax=unclassified Leptolyngbya TaxID=2650499 RepID=UPI0016850D9A|nr:MULTISPECIES: NUDIX hydrolase [unclassified Leptolyngbya]MBD1913722.1 NUDIX hydrolase [Leptolyngbya sp. FACHB-8]MBD2155690.1 NUDIX hydrolase [Leptolyngbya sp. FACHB-16]